MNKIIGYVLAVIGLIGVAVYSIPSLTQGIKLPAQLTGPTLLIVSVALAAIGVFIIAKGGGSKKVREVPIMAGKKVVGYRMIRQ